MKPIMERTNTLFVIVDIQERLAPSMATELWEKHLDRITFVQKVASLLKIPTILTEQYPKGLGQTLEQVASTQPSAYQERIEKTQFSCLRNPDFHQRLMEKTKPMDKPWVVLAGIETHVCVLQTALDLLHEGFSVAVLEDGTCSRSVNNHWNGLIRMANDGVTVTNSESLVFEWLRDAKDPNFRQVSALLKELG